MQPQPQPGAPAGRRYLRFMISYRTELHGQGWHEMFMPMDDKGPVQEHVRREALFQLHGKGVKDVYGPSIVVVSVATMSEENMLRWTDLSDQVCPPYDVTRHIETEDPLPPVKRTRASEAAWPPSKRRKKD